MRKFWQLSLVLFVWLAACSDDKAQQATALKQEVQDMLGKWAGSGTTKVLTYGDVTVTPDGDAYAVTIDKIAMTIPDEPPVPIGKISFKLTPDGDDTRKFSDVSLPEAITVKSADGKDVKVTLALDHATGSWSKKLGQFLTADILLKNLQAEEPSTSSKLIAADVFYKIDTKDQGQGVYDQVASAGTSLMTVADKDGQFAMADLKGSSNVSGAKLAELLAMRDEWQKAAGTEKPATMLPMVAKAFSLFKSMKMAVSVGQLTVSAGGTTMFSLGSFGFDFGMQDTDQPKVKVGSSIRYAGLAIPQLKEMVGGLGAEVLPTEFNMAVSIADMPISEILAAWSKTLPDMTGADQNAMMGTGMAAAGVAMQAIQQAAVKMAISDGKLKAPAVSGSFTGEVNTDPKTPIGFTGSANVELSDLDAVIAKAQEFANDPTTPEILGVLQVMRGLSDRGTDAAGKPIDRFKITMDAEGNPLVNGKALQPPAAEQPPASGTDSGTGTGTGTDTGSGTTSP